VHVGETINRLMRTAANIQQKTGRDASPDDIADELQMPADKVRRILDASRQTLSLETPVGNDGDANLADFIEDYHGATPAETATQTLLRERLNDALTRLPERERRIIQLRFGLEDGRSRTLEEVGREFGITRERTRQIEGEALRKLPECISAVAKLVMPWAGPEYLPALVPVLSIILKAAQPEISPYFIKPARGEFLPHLLDAFVDVPHSRDYTHRSDAQLLQHLAPAAVGR
jgi:RNA polymerase sigma factor (sigma-70 family)